jgi:lipopolysaccharide export system protein LptA
LIVKRAGQTLEAESGVAHLSEDEQRLDAVELRNQSRVTTYAAAPGALKGMKARDIDVKYGPDGETLQNAVLDGTSEIEVAGTKEQPTRRIAANHLEIALSGDGTTPKPLRVIESQQLEGTGEEGRGLTRARFTGDVNFRERNPNVERRVRSATLNVTVKAGLSEIEDARFERGVRVEDGDLTATAAQVRYVLSQGTLELTGSEPANPAPRMDNQRISVGASRIDVTLDGPVVVASTAVRSALKPAPPDSKPAKTEQSARVPSMFKQDQLVAGTADNLRYDGGKSSAVYNGNAQLWQGDTSIKGTTITIDQESGDLTAGGPVVTAIALEQEARNKTRERVHSTGTSKTFNYEESSKRVTYTGDAHMNGPQGDMAAAKIELYLKPSGNELDRAEAYEAVTLRDQNRETKGARMTYYSADERYVVTGAPVTITDECARVTTGRTVTFNKATDTVIVDGNQTRTATRGSANCSAR